MGVTVLIAGGGTGGHLMPALALADAIRRARSDVEPVLVGARRGIEAEILPRYSFRHHLLSLEPLHRRAWWRNARWPLVLWRLWRELGRLFAAERPALVIGTGGYASGPVVWWAQRAGIPTALQEQNAFPGLATRWLARRARQVHLGFPEARARLHPGAGTAVFGSGNPIRPPPREPGDARAARAALGLAPDRPTVLAFGGSQGARAINQALADALAARLLNGVNLLWGTGSAHASALATHAVPGRVIVQGFFDPMTPAYRAADLVVCRAGAMTTAELCAWGKPSVLIPLPGAAADHQTYNARALAAAGAAVVLSEADLTGASLAAALTTLLADPARLDTLGRAARARGTPEAADGVAARVLTLIQ
jgi:UDP-N-acetylglucosamine--N-acetylmuramyl-(pentapeptide) pyrophosphoryl-undecaprenol N-acetylglucosamine transferase